MLKFMQVLAWYLCCSAVAGFVQMWFAQGVAPVRYSAVLLAVMLENTLWALGLALGLPLAFKVKQAVERRALTFAPRGSA